jgi:hypothetical protein
VRQLAELIGKITLKKISLFWGNKKAGSDRSRPFRFDAF